MHVKVSIVFIIIKINGDESHTISINSFLCLSSLTVGAFLVTRAFALANRLVKELYSNVKVDDSKTCVASF